MSSGDDINDLKPFTPPALVAHKSDDCKKSPRPSQTSPRTSGKRPALSRRQSRTPPPPSHALIESANPSHTTNRRSSLFERFKRHSRKHSKPLDTIDDRHAMDETPSPTTGKRGHQRTMSPLPPPIRPSPALTGSQSHGTGAAAVSSQSEAVTPTRPKHKKYNTGMPPPIRKRSFFYRQLSSGARHTSILPPPRASFTVGRQSSVPTPLMQRQSMPPGRVVQTTSATRSRSNTANSDRAQANTNTGGDALINSTMKEIEAEKDSLLEQLVVMQSTIRELGEMLRKTETTHDSLKTENEKLIKEVNKLADENIGLRTNLEESRRRGNSAWHELEFYKLAARSRRDKIILLSQQMTQMGNQKTELTRYSENLLEQLAAEKSKNRKLSIKIREFHRAHSNLIQQKKRTLSKLNPMNIPFRHKRALTAGDQSDFMTGGAHVSNPPPNPGLLSPEPSPDYSSVSEQKQDLDTQKDEFEHLEAETMKILRQLETETQKLLGDTAALTNRTQQRMSSKVTKKNGYYGSPIAEIDGSLDFSTPSKATLAQHSSSSAPPKPKPKPGHYTMTPSDKKRPRPRLSEKVKKPTAIRISSNHTAADKSGGTRSRPEQQINNSAPSNEDESTSSSAASTSAAHSNSSDQKQHKKKKKRRKSTSKDRQSHPPPPPLPNTDGGSNTPTKDDSSAEVELLKKVEAPVSLLFAAFERQMEDEAEEEKDLETDPSISLNGTVGNNDADADTVDMDGLLPDGSPDSVKKHSAQNEEEDVDLEDLGLDLDLDLDMDLDMDMDMDLDPDADNKPPTHKKKHKKKRKKKKKKRKKRKKSGDDNNDEVDDMMLVMMASSATRDSEDDQDQTTSAGAAASSSSSAASVSASSSAASTGSDLFDMLPDDGDGGDDDGLADFWDQ